MLHGKWKQSKYKLGCKKENRDHGLIVLNGWDWWRWKVEKVNFNLNRLNTCNLKLNYCTGSQSQEGLSM